jgi:hypothetical protein
MPNTGEKKTFPVLLSVCLSFLILISCAKKEADRSDDGLAPYKSQDMYGYIGKIEGKRVSIEPRFTYAYPFSDGLAVVVLDRRMGYINTKGEFVITNRFERAYDFPKGLTSGVRLARVRIEGKYGFINRNGDIRIEPVYDDAWDFRNEIAKVQIGKKVFFIDTDNLQVTNFTEEQWTNFSGRPNRY